MTSIWAISDPHLSFGVPNKQMDIFSPKWKDHPDKIRLEWTKLVAPDDLVLIPGDISWAMHFTEVAPDLAWLDSLPGTKVMIRGNHDYWWTSYSRVVKELPPSLHAIHHTVYNWKNVSIGGTRLWDSPEFNFDSLPSEEIEIVQKSQVAVHKPDTEKIYQRELHRLEVSLKALDQKADYRIVMTHYPPIGLDLASSSASEMFEKYNINFVLFGHLHGMESDQKFFGERNGVQYRLTCCDYLNFKPLKILTI